jgi:hypothetical protein
MSRPIPTLGADFPPTFHRPFLRYFDGEAGAVGAPPAAPPAAQPPATPLPAPTPPPAAAPPAQPPATQTPPPINYQGNPDDYVRELRGEAKTHREAYEREQTAHQTTQQERDSAAAERDRLARENHLLRVAPKFGANPDLLLDSSSFMKTFADVDLADEAKVKAAIEGALERNSAFKAGPQLPGASGGGHQGGQPLTPNPTIEGAVKARLGG